MPGLLSLRADPNRLTKQDQPRVGLPPMTSPLTICVCLAELMLINGSHVLSDVDVLKNRL